jgi:hypothetical protein
VATVTLGQAIDSAVTNGAHWVAQQSSTVEVLIYKGLLYCFSEHGWQRFSPTATQLQADDWVPVDHVDLVAP